MKLTCDQLGEAIAYAQEQRDPELVDKLSRVMLSHWRTRWVLGVDLQEPQ